MSADDIHTAQPLFRPEAIEAHAEPDRPRILPPIAAPRVHALGALITAAVVVAAIISLAWPVPRLQRVAVVGLPANRGIVVVSKVADAAQLKRGDTVSADFGNGRPFKLRLSSIIGVRTPEQVKHAFGAGRLTEVATVPVGLARATVTSGGRVPLSDALVAGSADTGHERLIELIARHLG
ncbi:MAG: hypothetical protein ACR2OB_15350 [Solirubrobacteraceae bacterium]